MIDLERVAELRRELGDEDFPEVAELFQAEVEESLEKLRTADEDEARARLHFLKGSALNLGFAALAQACDAQPPGAPVDVEALDRIYRASLRELLDAAA